MDKKIIMRPDNKIFFNSRCLFIEYIDLIRSPYFTLLYAFSTNPPKLSENSIFDFSWLVEKTPEELTDFYYSRASQNVLFDCVVDKSADYDLLDKVLDQSMTSEIIITSPLLNLFDAVKYLMWKDSLLAKKVLIWYPYPNQYIQNDVEDIFAFSRDIHFISGPIEEALNEVPNDSTFIFSDITKVEVLESLGKLHLSSVLLPIEYGYNYSDPTNKSSDLLINLTEYSKDSTFKFDLFLASIDLAALEAGDNPTPETPE